MNKTLFYLLFIICIHAYSLHAQKVLLNDDFKFKDGVYYSTNIRHNAPLFPLEQLIHDIKHGYKKIYITTIHARDKNSDVFKQLSLDSIKVISYEGSIYIKIDDYSNYLNKSGKRQFERVYVFFKAIYTGNLFLFSVPIYKSYRDYGLVFSYTKSFEPDAVSNYQMNTNLFDSAKFYHYFLQLSDGMLHKLNFDNLYQAISSDSVLAEEMWKDYFAHKKFIYYINKYNERNPYYIEP
jgi:hypothetical protein